MPGGGLRYRPSQQISRAEFCVYRSVAEDFVRSPPAAILAGLNPGIPCCRGDFDLLAYFSGHPLFAETLRRYRPVAEIEGYRLLRRED